MNSTHNRFQSNYKLLLNMFNTHLKIRFVGAEMAVNLHLHVAVSTDFDSKKIDVIIYHNDGRGSNEHLQRLQQNS